MNRDPIDWLSSAEPPSQEKPFAGGLIGGESAFAGQDFNFDPLGLAVKCERYLPWFREVGFMSSERQVDTQLIQHPKPGPHPVSRVSPDRNMGEPL
eukprot:Skav211139  [mRNA]  locus=scaffold4091:170723:171912:+ [translate_table: standard]